MKIQTFYHKLPLKGRKMLLKRNIAKAKKDRREQEVSNSQIGRWGSQEFRTPKKSSFGNLY